MRERPADAKGYFYLIDEKFHRPRLLFVINSIGSGGAERVLDQILRATDHLGQNYECHLVLLDDQPEYRTFPRLSGRHCLAAQGSLVKSVIRLRKLVRQLRPVAVVSMLVRANIATVLATRGTEAGAILGERMHLSSHLAGRYRGTALWCLRKLPRLLYRQADTVIAVSEGVAKDLVDIFAVPAAKVQTINNPYDLQAITAAGARTPTIGLPESYLVAVGRLVAAKGFHELIEAYRCAAPNSALVILGDGPERERLAGQIAAAGLEERVLLVGYLPDPFPVIARARALVSASHNEGFPNAIAEAMVLGRPVLATDCPSGPAELLGAQAGDVGNVKEAPYGLIVRDHDLSGLVAGLRQLENDVLRLRLGAAASKRMQSFTAERVIATYWDAIIAVAAPRLPVPA